MSTFLLVVLFWILIVATCVCSWENMISVIKFYASALDALPTAISDAVSKLKEQCDTNVRSVVVDLVA